ncbi:MAG TPA: DMT family transporter [Mycobacterium sp.]|nr:DMT family transporter [Mycobacterium sp.]
MPTYALAIALGLTASFFFALAGYLQQRAARATERRGQTVISGLGSLMARLVTSRVWLIGWCVNLAGFVAQAVALHLGSIAIVQPMLATQLLFALPMSCLELRRWPTVRDWAAGVAICGGLVLFLISLGSAPMGGRPDRFQILIAAAVILAAIVLLLVSARRLTPELLNVLAAGAAGLCFSMTAVFIALTGDDLANHGIGYTATDWVGYGLAGSTLLGLVLEQAAFANGPLPWAIATKDSVNPIASFAIGILAFPLVLPTGPQHLAGITAAAMLLLAGAVGLAHSPSAQMWLKRPEDRRRIDPQPAAA